MLAIHYEGVGPGRVARVATPTFLAPEDLKAGGYGLMATPTLYPGQMVRARLLSAEKNEVTAHLRLYIQVYGSGDRLERRYSEPILLERGDKCHFEWKIPETNGCPIAEIGVEVGGHSRTGTVYLDWLGWGGTPDVTFQRPTSDCRAWRRAWVNAVDDFKEWGNARTFNLMQNEGMGMIYTGTREWSDYSMGIEGHAHLAESWGVVACVRGLRRYVALTLDQRGPSGRLRLVERYDEAGRVLAEATLPWELYEPVSFSITTNRDGSLAAICTSGETTVTLDGVIPTEHAFGAVGMFVQAGHCHFGDMEVEPVNA
jgi:hypothetical protein